MKKLINTCILGNHLYLERISLNEFIKKYDDSFFSNKSFNVNLIRSDDMIWCIKNISNNIEFGFVIICQNNKSTYEIISGVNIDIFSSIYFSECLNYIVNYLFEYNDIERVIFNIESNFEYFIDSINKSDFNGLKISDNYKYILEKKDNLGFNVDIVNDDRIDFNKTFKFYNKLYKKYRGRILNINDKLLSIVNNEVVSKSSINKYRKLLNDRKKILFEVINELLVFFNSLIENNITVYLSGSYSRESQRVFSDIDINFMYENNYIEKNIVIENLIVFFVTNIFDINYRDRVHAMGYLNLINNFPLNKSRYFASVFPDGNIILSTCRSTCYDIMYENINMPRSPKDITDYISKSNCINYIKEYIYNHEVVFTNYPCDHILDIIKKDDSIIICNDAFYYYFNLLINNLLDEIDEYKNNLKNNLVYVKEFKKVFKTIPSKFVYSMFFLLRRLEMKRKNDVNIELIKINFDKLKLFNFKQKFINKVEFDYYNYLFELNRIEYIFDVVGISLSSHTDDVMDKVILCYEETYNKSLYENMFNLLNELYDDLIFILNYLKEE